MTGPEGPPSDGVNTMLQLLLNVTEFPGSFGVSAHIWEVDEFGNRSVLAIVQSDLLDADPAWDNAVDQALDAVRRFSRRYMTS